MKQNTVLPPAEKFLAENPDYPSLPERRREVASEPAPKWKNLTLDELQAWADEEEKRTKN
jgi:hypothetical protein